MLTESRPNLKLNIGCGNVILPGYINMDSIALPGVDVVHDINQLPLPFEDDSVEDIQCISILEHVDWIPVLKDIHRILCPGGKARIFVPHFSAPDAFRDPTHTRFFTAGTFDFFVKGHKRDYYFDFHFSVVDHRIIFEKRKLYFYNYLLEPLVNISPDMQTWYERTPLRIFPAMAVESILIK